MKATKKAVLFAFATLATLPAVSSGQLRLWCEDLTPSPVCCMTISDSAGSGAEYLWVSNWGSFEDALTLVNWNSYHCDSQQSFYATLEVMVELGSLSGSMHVSCY